MNPKEPVGLVTPPNKTTVLLGVMIALTVGTAAGIGSYTFVYAKGASYLSNDPNACANCHVMIHRGGEVRPLSEFRTGSEHRRQVTHRADNPWPLLPDATRALSR